jgi:alpha-beta hydrolase superfamily lysophospholipase
MSHHEGNLHTSDGLRLHTQAWKTDVAPRAVVVFTHGQGDWSDRYRHVARAFNARGFAMYAYDLRGHGVSEGPRGHTPSYDAFLDDLRLVYEWASQENPGRKLFLYGHSLGGQITLNFALRRKPEVTGVIATGPWLRLAFDPPAFLVALGRVMNSVYPAFSQSNGIVPGQLSHDQAWIDTLHDPQQYHTRITAREYFAATNAAAYALQHAAELSLPLLLMHGQADPIISPGGTREFYERASSADKTLTLYEGMYHEITNETERQRVIDDLCDWLDKHA